LATPDPREALLLLLHPPLCRPPASELLAGASQRIKALIPRYRGRGNTPEMSGIFCSVIFISREPVSVSIVSMSQKTHRAKAQAQT